MGARRGQGRLAREGRAAELVALKAAVVGADVLTDRGRVELGGRLGREGGEGGGGGLGADGLAGLGGGGSGG